MSAEISPEQRPEPGLTPELLRRVPVVLYVAEVGDVGRWHYASPQLETMLGFSPRRWCDDPGLWASRLHPEDAERVLAREDAVADGDDPAGADEYRLLHADGHVVWVRDEAQLVADEDGTERWHGALSDISERKSAEAELERSAAQHAAVARLGEHALEGAGIADLAREALGAALELLDLEIGTVVRLSGDTGMLSVLAGVGLPDELLETTVAESAPTTSAYALHNGRIVVSDWETERGVRRPPLLAKLGIRSGLTVRIEGRHVPFGAIGGHSRRPRSFSHGEVGFVQALANVLGDALERQRTEDDIRHRALHDPLTGLPNRMLFTDRLAQAIHRVRRRGAAAILYIDIDRFQLINESLGHAVGDELVTAAARRLSADLRATDTVARFGADEFVILLEEIGGEHEAIELAERIAALFTRPFVLAGDEHFVTVSIGIAVAQPASRAEGLIADADAAMNRAKQRGRARYELFDEQIRGRAISRLRVESDLRRALERDELVLDYQPLVSLRDRSVSAVEALVRWEHPERGRIPPGLFIPVAEENGMIGAIGAWVLQEACRQAALWYRTRPDAAPLAMSVNLSAKQFEDRSLVDVVSRALAGSGLDPSLLGLELTESAMVNDADELTGTLERLKALGIQLVLDDFGTGYSSLSYLTRLPLDAVKVDRSFVAGLGIEPRDTAVTEAIVAMSHALSLQVVGEGAETERQVSELARLGCDLVQGYHFSRPVPAALIDRMLDTPPAWVGTGAPGGAPPGKRG